MEAVKILQYQFQSLSFVYKNSCKWGACYNTQDPDQALPSPHLQCSDIGLDLNQHSM